MEVKISNCIIEKKLRNIDVIQHLFSHIHTEKCILKKNMKYLVPVIQLVLHN